MLSTPVAGNPIFLVSAAVFAGTAVGLLTFYVSKALSSGELTVMKAAISQSQLEKRRLQGEHSSGLFKLALRVLPSVTPVTSKLPLDAIKKDLVERYARAGWPGGLTDDELVALSLITGVILMFLTLGAALLIKPPFAFLCVIGLLLGPGLVSNDLSGKAKARELAISRTLPFVLDLLVLTIRAGASLTMAMERVALDYDRHPIGQEFRATLGDIELGVTTRDSFKALGERNANVPSLRAFVDDLIQSEELGRPIADTLQRLSDGTRARRISEATAAAGNAKVMVLVPGMLIFIATLIILFAPFAVKYYYGGFSPDGQ